MHDLKDKVVLITGASRGIGRAMAIAFAKMGSKVIINYASSDDKAQEVLTEIAALGGQAELFKASIADKEQVKEMMMFVKKNYGRLDVLINNAGVTADNFMAMMTDEQWDWVIQTNLNGLFYCCRAFIKMMMAKKSGVIINLTSLSGLAGQQGQTNYSASKGGVISFTKALAREVARYGIRVNALAPGLIETDMTDKMPQDILEYHKGLIPLGRLGQPEEVANVALFLASDLSSYMTGEVLNISGGEYM